MEDAANSSSEPLEISYTTFCFWRSRSDMMFEYGDGAIGSDECNARAIALDCCEEFRGANWARTLDNVVSGVRGVEGDGECWVEGDRGEDVLDGTSHVFCGIRSLSM